MEMSNKEKRIPFQVKLLESNYNKTKLESEKLWLTMSAFLSILISSYQWMDVKLDNKNIGDEK